MKCLVECEIKQLIGVDARVVRFVIDDHGKRRSYAEVKAAACRMPDGSPIAEDWPPMWEDRGRSCWLPGLVEAEVSTPYLVTLDFPGDQRAHARPEAVRLMGTAGRPEYRLVVVGELGGAKATADQTIKTENHHV